ncbi:glycosyltransferase family 2 protein [Helicobacter trogontum]|uniref:Glycosyltransferase n=1 Tax=Helicobacter trogontum TaxID=50960 RepID=A0A4U8TBD5_9HELI|nr:glycosyltransferase family 2 protein [Helicobacter trogontum]MCI5786658.1 glycosyltransferase family 2 protein [Helicobacter trogontum]MDY5186160.1 glycosyltransferase family 2 protein [Helicobacter trogontum]TLD97073.1 glycosyltransferase [Helicobacter trogontum]
MKLSLIVPCYNESKSLEAFSKEVFDILDSIAKNSDEALKFECIFINDGSKDNTIELLYALKSMQPYPINKIAESKYTLAQDSTTHNLATPPKNCDIKVIDFTRNFGKEAAMYAGLKESNGDCVVIMDADLQDPPQLLPQMFKKWSQGEADIIYARRINRAGEGFVRSKLSEGFYTLHNLISSVHLESGVRDFRLLDRQVVNALLSMSEYHRFSKAMFEWVGFRKIGLEYENVPRHQGSSGWSLWKLFKYSVEGFISFSTMPLRIAFILGFIMSLLSLGYGIYAIIDALCFGNVVRGWTSLVALIVFIGGMQLIILGIIGEYIARIYEQVKRRPIYIKRYDNKISQQKMF